MAGTAEASEHCGAENSFKRYEVRFHLKIFKTKFPSLLIRIIETFDGKYKSS